MIAWLKKAFNFEWSAGKLLQLFRWIKSFPTEYLLNFVLTWFATRIVLQAIWNYDREQSGALIGMYIVAAQLAVGRFYEHPKGTRKEAEVMVWMLSLAYGFVVMEVFRKLPWTPVCIESAVGFLTFFAKVVSAVSGQSTNGTGSAPQPVVAPDSPITAPIKSADAIPAASPSAPVPPASETP